jgi:Flp pilus assembly CpaF family ATPase
LPYRAIKTNIGDSLNVIIQLERRPGRRYVSQVLEVQAFNGERDQYEFDTVYDEKSNSADAGNRPLSFDLVVKDSVEQSRNL